MSNEIAIKDVDSLLSAPTQKNELQATKDLVKEVIVSSFIPDLKVAYGSSDSVLKNKIATPGDWVLAGQTSFGDTIDFSVIAIRLHANIWDNKDKKSLGNVYHFPRKEDGTVNPLKGNKEWSDFVAKKLNAKENLYVGTDMFVYIPSANSFAVFFMKGTLSNFVNPILEYGYKPDICRVTTDYAESRNGSSKWYNLRVKKTSSVLEKEKINKELLAKYYNLFLNPKKGGVEEVSEEEAAPQRVR